MILFILTVCIVSIFEIGVLIREKNNRVLAVYVGLAIITLITGVLCLSKSSEESFANLFFHMTKIRY